MATELPMACTLNPEQLERRLEEISAVGAASFIAADAVEGRHRLRFRPDDGARRKLEEIVAAEAECCFFLDLSVDEVAGELVLIIDAPSHGRDAAAAIASAFATPSSSAAD